VDEPERSATLRAGIELFNRGRYLAAHELFEELWEDTQGPDSDFYKGLIQASVALHHDQQGNAEGAAKLQGGTRRCLARYLPAHRGLDLERFLEDLRDFLARARDAAPRLLPGPVREVDEKP